MKRKIGVKAQHKKFERECVELQVKEWWKVNWYKFTTKEKKSLGLPILLKTIKEQHEMSGTINMLPPVKLGGKKLDFNVGARVA